MDPTSSLSKGCFVFNAGNIKTKKRSTGKQKTKTCKAYKKWNILSNEMKEQPFYKVYKETWQCIQEEIKELQNASNQRMLDDLVYFVKREQEALPEERCMEDVLPTAVLLTGINQPDHLIDFHNLVKYMQKQISCSICLLHSRDCQNMKSAMETLVFNLIQNSAVSLEGQHQQIAVDYDSDADNDDVVGKKNSSSKIPIKRSQCTLRYLKRWYYNNWPIIQNTDGSKQVDFEQKHMLIVILSDFEGFPSTVLQDVMLLLSNYCMDLPFVVILGVATSVAAIHQALPCHVTCKMALCLFQAATAPMRLNEILDKVILSPRYAFHLSGKSLKFLTDIFLYYDFSITGLIQGYQYCMMEHFFQGNAYTLCTRYSQAVSNIEILTHGDLESIRQLLSFRPYVEHIKDPKEIIALLTDDSYLKQQLLALMKDCHLYYLMMRVTLELLTVLVGDLPKNPLGKYRRELYATCLTKDITKLAEFRESWKLISFLSKHEFVEKILKAVTTTRNFLQSEIAGHIELADEYLQEVIMEKLLKIENLLDAVNKAGQESNRSEVTGSESLTDLTSRHDLKQKLLQMSKQPKAVTEYTKSVQNVLEYIESNFLAEYLRPLNKAPPLYELYFFCELAAVRRNIMGSPRAALQMALTNPNLYLQCKCCDLNGQLTQIVATMPDVCIAYKLHLECGHLINLYDWLQAFRCIVDYNDDDDEQQQDHISPEIQARYTRAIAELQFLGYIKISKRKTDHVQRLTW